MTNEEAMAMKPGDVVGRHKQGRKSHGTKTGYMLGVVRRVRRWQASYAQSLCVEVLWPGRARISQEGSHLVDRVEAFG